MLMLLFFSENTPYAIDTEHVLEALPTVWVKPIAGLPNYVPGAILLSGMQIPVVDFVQLVNGRQSQNKMHTRLILINENKEDKNSRLIALRAEKVTQTYEVAPDEIFEKTVSVKEFPFFDGVFQMGNSMVRIVDVQSFFKTMEGVIF